MAQPLPMSSFMRKILFYIGLFSLAGCSLSIEVPHQDCNDGRCDGVSEESGMCVAIRGNGPLITSHWHSLARITEEYGAPVGFAGGSSASVTGFLYDSILLNPAVQPGAELRDEKIALLLKSLVALPSKLKRGTDEINDFSQFTNDEFASLRAEADALGGSLAVIEKLKNMVLDGRAISDQSFPFRPDKVLMFVAQFNDLLDSGEIKSKLINPNFVNLMNDSAGQLLEANEEKRERLHFILNDLIRSIKEFGSFSAPNAKMFIRPGLINFKEFSRLMGFVGNFYAGGEYARAPEAHMTEWLDSCADNTKGLTWFEIEQEHPQCVADFFQLMVSEKDAQMSGNSTSSERLADDVGQFSTGIVTTSIISGQGTNEIEKAKAEYLNGQEPELTINWDDVSFGYWGSNGDDTKAQIGLATSDDPKLEKSKSLGKVTWGKALSLSPAEPGLSSVLSLENDQGQYSAGGWSDLHPVNALTEISNCEAITYLTRRGEDSTFAQGTAMALGLDDPAVFSSLELEDSSFSKALQNSDLTWCTHWDNIDRLQLEELAKDAYNAPAQVNNPEDQESFEKFMSYEKSSSNLFNVLGLEAKGCTSLD